MNSSTVKRGLTGLLALVVGSSLSLGTVAIAPASASAEGDVDEEVLETPGKVTGLELEDQDTTSLEIGFDEDDYADTYEIAYRESSSDTWLYKTTTDTEYVLKGLKSNTTYKVKVRGISGNLEGAWSSVKTYRTLLPAPAKVKGVKLAKKTASSLKVKWSKAKNATEYRITYKKSSSGSWKHKTTTAKNYTLKGLKDGTKYKVKVRGENADWYGTWSTTKAYQTRYAKPAKVTVVKLAKKTTSSIKVKWSKAKYAKKYQVAYRKSSSGTWHYKTAAKRSCTISGLNSAASYKVKVRGINSSKKGSWSSTKTYKTKAKAQKKSSASSNTQSGLPSTVYITRTGTKYHKSWCPSLRYSRFAISISAAEAEGYTACKICF